MKNNNIDEATVKDCMEKLKKNIFPIILAFIIIFIFPPILFLLLFLIYIKKINVDDIIEKLWLSECYKNLKNINKSGLKKTDLENIKESDLEKFWISNIEDLRFSDINKIIENYDIDKKTINTQSEIVKSYNSPKKIQQNNSNNLEKNNDLLASKGQNNKSQDTIYQYNNWKSIWDNHESVLDKIWK